MKSIKTKPNSAKGPDKAKIVNKLYCILLTTLELTSLYFFRKKTDMKFIILVSNLKDISPSIFSWKKKKIKTTIQFCQNTIQPKKDKLCLRVEKWSRSVNIFFLFLHKSCWILLCRFRVESVNIFIFNMCFFSKQFRTCANALPNEITV
jgi:hypothetical protein